MELTIDRRVTDRKIMLTLLREAKILRTWGAAGIVQAEDCEHYAAHWLDQLGGLMGEW